MFEKNSALAETEQRLSCVLQSLSISSPRYLAALGQTGATLEGDNLYLHVKRSVKWHLMIPYDQDFSEDI